MIDIKHLDPQKHKSVTGVSNHRILANIRRLAATGKPIIFSIPVVPSVNDTCTEIQAIAGFVAGLRALRVDGEAGISLQLLPFHRLAADKYTSLGLEYLAADLRTPDKQTMFNLVEAARELGVPVSSS